MKMKLLIAAALCSALYITAAEFDKGIDLTSKTSVRGSELNQLVDNAWPSTNRGIIYKGSSAPDTVTYPKYTNYIWIDTSSLPYSSKLYVTGSWVSATLGNGVVTTANLADNSVSNPKLQQNAVNTTNISDNAITDSKISAGAVVTSKIGDSQVTSAKILDGTIATADIGDSQITTPLLANASVTAAKLAAGVVVSTNIADNSISNVKLTSGAVVRTNLAAESVASTNLVLGTARYQTPRMNVGNTAWELTQPVYISQTNFTFLSTNTWNHALPSTPHIVQAYYVVGATSIAGWATGEQIPLNRLVINTGTTGNGAELALGFSATQVFWSGRNGSGSITVPTKATGVTTTVAPSSFDGTIRIVAIYYNQATEN